jgi:predicted nucleotidyltransferase
LDFARASFASCTGQPLSSRATIFVMHTAEPVIATLRAHEAELRQAGLRSLSLFGSVARGETEPDSHIDLAAEFEPPARMDLLRLAAKVLIAVVSKEDPLAQGKQTPRFAWWRVAEAVSTYATAI